MADNMDLQIRIVGEDDTSGSFGSIDRALGDLQRLADDVSRSFESFSRSISGVFGDAGRSVSELTNPMREIASEAHSTEQSLSEMLRPLFDTHAESAANEIARSLENVGTAARDATREIETMDRTASRPASPGGHGGSGGHGENPLFGNEMQNNAMYAGMSMGAMALPLVGAIKASTDAYGQFSQAMANVNSMMGLSAPQLDNMSNKVLELSKNVPDGPVALANALYGIVGAGVPAADQMAVLTTASKAATAGQTDVGTATNALIAVMNSYGMSGKDVTKISDQMFAANAAGAMTFDSFARSIGNVAGPAAQAGVGFDQVAAATAALTNQGMTAQRATQGLRALLVGIMAPTSGASKEAKKLGISWDENTLKSKGMVGMLQAAMKATGGNSQELKKLIPNIAAWTVAVDLGGKGANSFKQAMDTMSKSSGATNKAMEEQKKGFQEQTKEMQNSIQTAEIAFAKGFIPVLVDVASKVAAVAEWFSKLSPGTQKLIGEITLGAAAFLTLGAGFFMAISGIGALVSGFTGIANALKLVTGAETLMEALSPVGWVIAITAAVVAVSVLIYQHWGQIKAFLSQTWNSIVSVARQVWGSISSFFSGLWSSVSGFFVSAWQKIQSTAISIWNGIINFFRQWGVTLLAVFVPAIGLPLLIAQHWSQITSIAQNIWNGAVNVIKNIWNGAISWIQSAAQDFVNIIVNAFNWMYNHNYYFQDLVDFIRKAWQTIETDAQSIWNTITSFLQNLWNGIVNTARSMWSSLSSTLSSLWNSTVSTGKSIWSAFSSAMQSMWRAISSAASSIWHGITSTLTSLWNSAVSMGKSIWNGLATFLSGLWHSITSAVSSAWNALKNTVATQSNNAVNAAKAPFNSLGSFFSGLYGEAEQWGANLINSVGNGIKSAVGAVTSAVSGAVSSIAGALGFHDIPGLNIAKHASGGIFNQPHLGLVAEAGPEAVIPLSNPSRGLALWKQAGMMLGGFNNINTVSRPMASGNGGNGGGVVIQVYASGNIVRNERELGDIVSRAILDKTKMQGKF